MEETAGESVRPQRTRKRLGRGTLTRERIVEAALRILDEGPATALTFARLGKELQASPTAMYRHFPSRDEIETAVADELIRISIEGYEPSESWMDSLRDLAFRAWNTFSDHPAAATHTYYRVTQGPHEIRAVEAILAAVHQAGWRGAEAVFQYQMFANMILALSGRNAAVLAAAEASGADRETFWIQEYRPARPEEFPHVTEHREELRTVFGIEVYRGQVEALLEAMAAARP